MKHYLIQFCVGTALAFGGAAYAGAQGSAVDYTRLKPEQFGGLKHQQTFFDDTTKETFRVINDERNKGVEVEITTNGSSRYVKHGAFYRYYKGAKTEMITYHYGKKHGLRESYNKAGVIKFSHQYEDNIKSGPHVQRNDKNEVVVKVNYVDGRKHGVETNYSSGKLSFKKNWVNGKLDGEHLQYNSKGKVVARKSYSNGKPVGKTIWY